MSEIPEIEALVTLYFCPRCGERGAGGHCPRHAHTAMPAPKYEAREYVPRTALDRQAREIEKIAAELDEIAADWRGDWSDFDGRTLLAQIDPLTARLRALAPKEADPHAD